MASEVLLPKQGNTVESCIIVQWKMNEGDAVKTGDVLMEVNGKKLKSRSDASALIQEMRGNADSVTVKVQRDGETVERNYNFQ